MIKIRLQEVVGFTKMNVKGQLKIQQMAFMLMAVFLFFLLAGVFYLAMQTQEYKKQATSANREYALSLANMIVNSPEFTCGDSCIDADRVMVLRNNSVYRNFWNVKTLEIRIIGNESKDIPCSSGNYPNCNYIKIYGGEGTSISTFISVCFRQNNNDYIDYKCKLGRIILGYEIKT